MRDAGQSGDCGPGGEAQSQRAATNIRPITFGSMFAGIGGFDLGLERSGMTCVWQVEIDDYATKVLERHWPNVPRHRDVMTFNPCDFAAVDVVAAGFPCQDISHAGKRAGISASRSGLYGQVMRCLRMVPQAIGLLENVAALLSRGMGKVLGDVAAVGRDAEWDCISASRFGALHRRDRVFITIFSGSYADCVRRKRQPRKDEAGPWSKEQFERLVQAELQLSVPAGKSGGISDGVSNRSHRLRCLGNAVVPQVAEHIGRLIIRDINKMENGK